MRITVQNRYLIVLLVSLSVFQTIAHFQLVRTVNELQANVKELEKLVNQKSSLDIESLRKHSLIDFDLLKSIIVVESNGNENAYNTATGAVGLMQLRPIVYEKICGLTKAEAFVPAQNIACGSLFFKHLTNKFKGNIEKALLYYNNGHEIVNGEYAEDVLNIRMNGGK